jgi:hypothetical protein
MNMKNKKIGIPIVLLLTIAFLLSSSMVIPSNSPVQTHSFQSGNSFATSAVSTKYAVSFIESGLASGTSWSVTLNGSSNSSTTTHVNFYMVNGNYAYSVTKIAGYSNSPISGNVTVNGASQNVTVVFSTASTSIAPVNLGAAGNFSILAKTGISTTGTTAVIGNMGISPASATYITGFALTMSSNGQFSTSSLVTGKVYAADYTSPTPSMLTTSVNNMMTAYTNAAGRTNPNYVNLGAGNVGGMTLGPGLYKWSTGLLIPTSVTLSGNSTSVWIFQISGRLTVANGAHIILSGGAQAKNIFWQVAGGVTIGTTVSIYGIILSQTAITINTGSTLNGRALAQSAVTLNADNVTSPTGVSNIVTTTYAVTITESGLPSGSTWFVNITGLASSGPITSTSYTTSLVNGTYAYVAGTTNSAYKAPNGSFTVSGAPATHTVTFSKSGTSVTHPSTSNTTTYLIVGAVIAVAAIGAAIALMRRKKL